MNDARSKRMPNAPVDVSEHPNPIPGKFSAHDLWHLFTLGGSAYHFITMLYTITILYTV